MKTIALMPVRNEAWILAKTLPILDAICDVIIIGDQMSDDGSREIYNQFPKILVIENEEIFHTNMIRWRLLDAARNFDGNNLIICCDADEVFPPRLFEAFLARVAPDRVQGQQMHFRWIQLWKTIRYYRNDDVWHENWQKAAFIDDRNMDYERRVAINDHTPRLPGRADCPNLRVAEVPLLHFQWVAWTRTQLKQAYYRCAELIHDPHDPVTINTTYSHSFDDPDAKLISVPEQWLEGIDITDDISASPVGWHLGEIMTWFDQYGITYFEPLQIWQIAELRAEFRKRVGREPKPNVRAQESAGLIRFKKKMRRSLKRMQRKWDRLKATSGLHL
jgi:glycosyltransferase involved in cell wall biosynthesis